MTDKQSFKVILCGESSVGKTTLMGKLSCQYNGIPDPTMSCNFSNITAEYDGKEVNMSFWDTAGQEQYRSLVKIFFRGADVVIYVCDLTSKLSLNSLEYWIEEAAQNVGDVKPAGLIVANKTDLRESIEITDNDLKDLSKMHKIKFMKVSAISGENLQYLKSEIARICLQHNENPNIDTYIENNTPQNNNRKFKLNLLNDPAAINDDDEAKPCSC